MLFQAYFAPFLSAMILSPVRSSVPAHISQRTWSSYHVPVFWNEGLWSNRTSLPAVRNALTSLPPPMSSIAFDTAAAGVDIADNVAHVLLRHRYLYLHDRLKKYRACLCHSILERHGSGNVECHLGGVDLMVGTVVYICAYAQYRESAKDTSLCSLFDTLADSRDVFLRNRTADNGGSRT